MSVVVTSQRCSCSRNKSGDSQRAESFQQPVPAGQVCLPRASKRKALMGRACHPTPGAKSLPVKRCSVIKHFLFVGNFMVIFTGSFTSHNSASELCGFFFPLIKCVEWSGRDKRVGGVSPQLPNRELAWSPWVSASTPPVTTPPLQKRWGWVCAYSSLYKNKNPQST